MTLYPVSITEARDSAGFNVSAFIASVPLDAEATPGKKSIMLTHLCVQLDTKKHTSLHRILCVYTTH